MRRAPHPALAPLAVLVMLPAAAFGAVAATPDVPPAGSRSTSEAVSAVAVSGSPIPGAGLVAAAERADRARPVELDPSQDVAAPTRVRIPGIGVDSSLEDLRIDDAGRLASPREWQQAGWFADGVEPGAVGPAVIAGHVDSPTGPAVFADLGRLRPGDVVEVERADGRVARFEVDRAEVVGKGDFPTEEVYGPTPDAQLRLITCDGAYVSGRGGYQANLVVWATQVDA